MSVALGGRKDWSVVNKILATTTEFESCPEKSNYLTFELSHMYKVVGFKRHNPHV